MNPEHNKIYSFQNFPNKQTPRIALKLEMGKGISAYLDCEFVYQQPFINDQENSVMNPHEPRNENILDQEMKNKNKNLNH